MNTVQEMVKRFHEVSHVPMRATPGFPSVERCKLRADLIDEETKEFRDAVNSRRTDTDFVEAIDALGDLLYVVYGAALEFGVDLEPIVQEIHRSNLTKLPPDGMPIVRVDGKVLKGPNYEPPNIRKVLGL